MNEIVTLTPEKIITTIKNKKTGEVYKTEEALKAANENDLKPMNSLLSILKKPYVKEGDIEKFQVPSNNQHYQTFCGT